MGGGGKMQLFQRTASLYANYWLVFLIFIPLACFIKPDRYPENISSFILNFIGWKCSYNGEWWFFFPYILLILTSPYILRLLHKPGAKGSFATSIALFGMFALCNTGEKHSSVIQMPVQYITVLSMFANGVLFARFDILQRFRNCFSQYSNKHANMVFGSAILFLFMLRISLGSSGILNPVFALPFILFYLCMRPPLPIRKALCYFGRHSTNLWLIHTFFAYYLFHDFIYGFHFPILIYAALIVSSLAASHFVQWLYIPIRQRIRKR